MSELVIEANEMSTGYAGVPVVRGLNLQVHAGEVVALLGPNGAGKTTTLLACSGLVHVLAGSLNVLGEPVNSESPYLVARRGVAHVPEDRSLFFALTVAENLRLGLRGTRAQRAAAIDQALDLLPALRPLMNRVSGLLSGGEQQMLAVGRAIVAQPKVLMVDEMSLGLAPIIVERLLPIVRQVADETGAGVLFVEQHIHMALEITDRAYVMSHGECVMEGTAAELSQSRELLEASYLGEQAVG